MKTIIFKGIFITYFALVSWLAANGQPGQDSLVKYVEAAINNNPEVLQKFNEYQAALQKVIVAGSLPDPELSLGVFLKPMELVSGSQAADFRLMQMFPWFGVLRSAKDEISLMANAKFELFHDTKLQVIYDVQRTWYELFKIQKNISISEKNLEILKTIETLALTKFKDQLPEGTGDLSSGLPGLADIYLVQIEKGDMENSILLLRSQLRTINARFNSYLNRAPDRTVYIADTLTSDSAEISFIPVPDTSLAKNPMLGMLEFERQSIEARKKMITRMSYPMVGLGLDYMLINKNTMSVSSMNGKDMIVPMVTLTLPVNRRKYTAMSRESDLLQLAASEKYQSAANSLQNEYYEATRLLEDGKLRMKLFDNQYKLTARSLDLTLKRFSVSSSGLTDVLRVRQQLLDYEFKKVEAVVDYNIAVAWLKRLGNLQMK